MGPHFNCLTLLVKVFLPTDSLTYEDGSLLALFCKGKPTMWKVIFSGWVQDSPSPSPFLHLPQIQQWVVAKPVDPVGEKAAWCPRLHYGVSTVQDYPCWGSCSWGGTPSCRPEARAGANILCSTMYRPYTFWILFIEWQHSCPKQQENLEYITTGLQDNG